MRLLAVRFNLAAWGGKCSAWHCSAPFLLSLPGQTFCRRASSQMWGQKMSAEDFSKPGNHANWSLSIVAKSVVQATHGATSIICAELVDISMFLKGGEHGPADNCRSLEP